MDLPGALLQKWDELSRAIGALQNAQPANMTAASLRLDVAKEAFEAALNEAAFTRTHNTLKTTVGAKILDIEQACCQSAPSPEEDPYLAGIVARLK